MSKQTSKGLDPLVERYICIHSKSLITSGHFASSELEDIKQELWLFYFEKIHPRRKILSNDYIFIAIKGHAMHLLRTRLKIVHSGLFFADSLEEMQENTGFDICDTTTLEDITKLEDKESLDKLSSSLSTTEQSALKLVLNGATTLEVVERLGVSKAFLTRIIRKMKK